MKSRDECKEAFDAIKRRFSSGNKTPVERAMITRKEIDGAFRHWLSTLCSESNNKTMERDFQEWLEDPFTHWISDTDAAWQAWMEKQEEIDLLKARIKELEGEGILNG